LEKQGAKAVGDSSKNKKALAWRFYELRRKILKDVQSLDSSSRTDMALEANKLFSAWGSKNKINNNNTVKKEIAASLVQVIDIVATIDAHLKDKEGASDVRVTRGDAKKKTVNKSKKQQFYDDILQLKEDVVKVAYKKANESQPNN